jgi:MFS family permease
MQQALSLSHTQIGNLLSTYGMVAMVSYFIGGWFADKFSVKRLITLSLVISGLLGFYFATFPSYSMLVVIFILWGFTTIMIFFPASVKVIRMLGDESEQGRLFGFYEGLSGIAGTLISFIGLYFFGKFAAITVGFKYVGMSISSFLKVITMPKAWLIELTIFSVYLVFSSLTYLSPYLSEVYVMPLTVVSALSIIRTYVIKMGASPITGIVTDKVGSSIKVLFVGFLLMAVSTAAFLVIPKSSAFMWVAVINMIILSVILFGARGIYFATVSKSNISIETTGAIVGFASFLGFSPDAFYYTIAGNWLDKYGQTGYTYIFILSVVCAFVGIFSTYTLMKMNKKGSAKAA